MSLNSGFSQAFCRQILVYSTHYYVGIKPNLTIVVYFLNADRLQANDVKACFVGFVQYMQKKNYSQGSNELKEV